MFVFLIQKNVFRVFIASHMFETERYQLKKNVRNFLEFI